MLKGLHQITKYGKIYTFHIDSTPFQRWSDAKHLLNFKQEVREPLLTFANGSSIVIDNNSETRVWTSDDLPF